MLKITLIQEAEPPTLKLEGRLTGPWVSELQHNWNDILKRGLGQSVVVDLSDVISISPEGKQFLKSLIQQGASLQSRSLMTQFILNQIKNEPDQ
jgi:anti-anti-sigma regulatory factor